MLWAFIIGFCIIISLLTALGLFGINIFIMVLVIIWVILASFVLGMVVLNLIELYKDY